MWNSAQKIKISQPVMPISFTKAYNLISRDFHLQRQQCKLQLHEERWDNVALGKDIHIPQIGFLSKGRSQAKPAFTMLNNKSAPCTSTWYNCETGRYEVEILLFSLKFDTCSEEAKTSEVLVLTMGLKSFIPLP